MPTHIVESFLQQIQNVVLAVYTLYYRHQRKQHEIRNIVTELIRIVLRMNEHRSKWRNSV